MRNKNNLKKVYKVYNARYNMKTDVFNCSIKEVNHRIMEKGFKRNYIFLFLVLGVILISLSFVVADGMYVPHPGYYVSPGQQRAVIFHEDNIETMILTSGFIGNAKDLAWIVPTPTRPDVTKANENVFTNAAKLARVTYSNGISYGAVMMAAESKDAGGVYVIDSKQVDYYDVKVLVATNSADLVKWFNDNDYVYPKEYSYVLDSYIQKGWYFTAIKVSPESTGATEVIQDLKEGNPTPIKMVFLSDKIVFPLKISSVDYPKTMDTVKYGSAVNEPIGATRKDASGGIYTKRTIDPTLANWCRTYSDGSESCVNNDYINTLPGGVNYVDYNSNVYRYGNYIPIQIYVFSNGKYEADNFNIQYANWVSKNDIVKLGNDEYGNPFIEPKKSKYFLTSLSSSMKKSQMDDDVYFTKAANNSKVNAGPEAWELFLQGLIWGLVVFIIWIFIPIFGILFIIGILILFLSINKSIRILGWVLGIISFALTFIVGVFFFLIAAVGGGLGNYIVISLLITWLVILGLMVVFTLLAVRYRRK